MLKIETHCPHCGAKKKQLWSTWYCPNDCDRKTAAENKQTLTIDVPDGQWFPLSGYRLIDSPWLSNQTNQKSNKVLLLSGQDLFKIYDELRGFRFTRFPHFVKPEGSFYVGRNKGLSQFFWHYDDPKKQNGFYGASFTLKMEDGTFQTIQGPYSSRSGAVNQLVADEEFQMVDVAVTDPSGVRNRFHITLPFARHLAAVLKLKVEISLWYNEPNYEWMKA